MPNENPEKKEKPAQTSPEMTVDKNKKSENSLRKKLDNIATRGDKKAE